MTRRIRGQRGVGSIRERHGSWWIRTSFVDADGRRRWRNRCPYATRQEAETVQATLQPLDPSRAITVKEWLDRWSQRMTDDLRARQRESRADELTTHLNTWIVPHIGDRLLGELAPSDCDEIWRVMLRADRAVATMTVVGG